MTTPVVSSRTSTTPRYSGVTSITACSQAGNALSGKNVAENRNSGSVARVMYSKSCHERM